MAKAGSDSNHLRNACEGESRPGKFTRVLMSRPEHFSLSESVNPLSRNSAPINLPLALTQWEQLSTNFKQVGHQVSLVEPCRGLEKKCFAATQSFAGVDHEGRPFVVPSRTLHRSRRDEVEHFTRWYSRHGYRIVELDLDDEELLEGSGDLLWNYDGESIWAGYGPRSTPAAIDQFAALMGEMGFEVRKLELVDPRFFHLNLCLTPLAPYALLIYPGAFAPETLARIRRHAQTLEISREEALQFVCNGVSVNGYYITPRLTNRLEQILSREGIKPIVVELSEFQKAGGSVASLKILLP